MKIKTGMLKDDPAAIPTLAAWFAKEWGYLSPDYTFEGFCKSLPERAQTDRLPICLVGYVNGEAVATATIKFREIEYAPSADFWIGSVFVREDMRQKQLGTQIVAAAEDFAQSRGYCPLYLYTGNKEAFYERLGWQTVGERFVSGSVVKVMSKLFPSPASV
ncbi:MAG: GNAT family N-acetyltransferase [Chthoniobacteraceae bacterium]